MRKFNCYWTPCATHCLDLMLEDVAKRDTIARVVDDARRITKLVYNHGLLLAKLREQGEGEIIRPGPTRFATNYLALSSLRNKKQALKAIINSDWWERLTFCATLAGSFVEDKVNYANFWLHLDGVCKVLLYLV